MSRIPQRIPATGPAREGLRAKGQFWTPDWVAEAMVAYVLGAGGDRIFDPAVGAGAFFQAAKKFAEKTGKNIHLSGYELDRAALMEARENGLSENDLREVQIEDFLLQPPRGRFPAIIANPPYIRHHRLGSDLKKRLRALAQETIHTTLDGRAGLHIYFLLRSLQLLGQDGRLAFIMPSDTCEGIFSSRLWKAVTGKFCLEAVITFDAEASPFPEVDTNPVIFLIRNAKPAERFFWARCKRGPTDQLQRWIADGLGPSPLRDLVSLDRSLEEGLATGLSRAFTKIKNDRLLLGDFAKVMRGIATGANDFFFLTASKARELKIPAEFLIKAIGRTRDVSGDQITDEVLKSLEDKGRPTWLFSPDGRSLDAFSAAVREYLLGGEKKGLHQKALISTRKPWYKMETRPAPPILFAYLGRRNVRFILNRAGALPLTGFLCVYPYEQDPAFITKLLEVLNHPATLKNLSLVGKSYGGGAIKVEPRALERLPLDEEIVASAGLRPIVKAGQLTFPY